MLEQGATVVALMGGMGRTRNGSYAEYVVASRTNVVPLRTSLSWTDLAALPESYATAWSALHGNLGIAPGHSVLVRGATSALGQAAVNIAAGVRATVIATTRRAGRSDLLHALGARHVLVDGGAIAPAVRELIPQGVDRVLDLVGNSVLRDSLAAAAVDGRACQAGFLGGLGPVDGFLPIVDMPSGVHLSFFGSFGLGGPAFPLSAVPLQRIVERVEGGVYRARPARVFRFEEIADAHRLMESGDAGGKLVVSVALMAAVFHEGELAVQRRAGVERVARQVGRGVLPAVPEEFAEFLRRRPLVAVDSVHDREGAIPARWRLVEPSPVNPPQSPP